MRCSRRCGSTWRWLSRIGCGWVQEHGGKSSHFPAISLSGPHPLAYWHLSNPVIEHVGCVFFFRRPTPQNISEQIELA